MKILIASLVGSSAFAAAPHLVLSLLATVVMFTGLGLAGAWLIDRFDTSLPGRYNHIKRA